MKDEQKVFIRGVEGRGSEVIKTLEDLGGKKPPFDIGGDPSYIYYITHDWGITGALYDSEVGKIIMDFYHEIKLQERWKDGDIIVENNTNPVYSVFKSEEGNGKFSEYFCVTNDAIIKANIFRSISKWHLANKEERKTFTNLLHKHHRDWDVENKQLVGWRWKPKYGETYYYITDFCEVTYYICNGSKLDWKYRNVGNCFQTKEEAEAAAERVKKALKGE